MSTLEITAIVIAVFVVINTILLFNILVIVAGRLEMMSKTIDKLDGRMIEVIDRMVNTNQWLGETLTYIKDYSYTTSLNTRKADTTEHNYDKYFDTDD